MTRPLIQALRTNATLGRESGFRWLSLPGATEDEAQAIEQFVSELSPKGKLPGLAACCFTLKAKRHVGVCAAYRDFAPDNVGRGGGSLAHLLLVPWSENDPALFVKSLLPLLPESRPAEQGAQSPLEDYMSRYFSAGEVDVSDFDPGDVAALPSEVIQRFVFAAEASSSGIQTYEVGFPAADGMPMARLLADLSGLLPPSLRHRVRWGCGLNSSRGLTFVTYPAEEVFGTQFESLTYAPGFSAWLLDRLAARAYDDILKISNDGSIRSWEDLDARVAGWRNRRGSSVGESDAEVGGYSQGASEETTVPKSKKSGKQMKQADDHPVKQPATAWDAAADLAPMLDRQYEALNRHLTQYIETRLKSLPVSHQDGLSSLPRGRQSSLMALWFKWRPEIYFVLLLLIVGFLWLGWKAPEPRPVRQKQVGSRAGARDSVQ